MSQLPIDGVYHGSFHLANETVQENHVEITFTKRGEKYKLNGTGSNKFGEFKLVGEAQKLMGDKYSVDMYKIYNFMEEFHKFRQIKQEVRRKDVRHHTEFCITAF